MSKVNKLAIAVFAAVVLFGGGGCQPIAKNQELVEVKCVSIHIYGDSIAKTGWMNERFTHMVVERTDTRERRVFGSILGKTNEVFMINWNENQ